MAAPVATRPTDHPGDLQLFRVQPADGVYKFISIAQGLSTGKVALSEYYRFRVGGPNSSSCCP